MPMRTFTIYPEPAPQSSAPQDETAYAIRATYPEAALQQRYGALEVCRGWTRDQVLEQFRKVHRYDAAAILGRELRGANAVQIQMGSDELRLWNN